MTVAIIAALAVLLVSVLVMSEAATRILPAFYKLPFYTTAKGRAYAQKYERRRFLSARVGFIAAVALVVLVLIGQFIFGMEIFPTEM